MLWFKNLKISKKLLSGFLVVAIIATLVGAVGLINIRNMNQSSTLLYEGNTLGLKYISDVATLFQRIRYNSLELTVLSSDADIEEGINKLNDFCDSMYDELDLYSGTVIDGGATSTLFSTVQSEWERYKSYMDQVVAFVDDGNLSSARNVILAVSDEVGTALRDNLEQLMDLEAHDAQAQADKNAAEASTATIIMITIVLAALLLAVLLGVWISRQISIPLGKITSAAEMLAVGDLNAGSIISDKKMGLTLRKDEIGILAGAFNELIVSTTEQVHTAHQLSEGDLTVYTDVRSENDQLGKGISDLVKKLNSLVASIVAAADQVASGSNLVSESSVTLSQGATEQASTVEELTASVEEISSQTSQNAKNAEKANDLALNAKSNANSGNEQMKEMLSAMDEINTSSGSIYKIIKVIEDIAFQTNILALNAAVEAARAGQHGKGFAVVAEEVRTLAARSSKADSETAEMIEDSINKVNAGTKIANDTAEALTKIVEEVENVANLVDSIALASKEQSLGIEQLNQGIIQVSQVVQTNAATSEESAAASEELSAQAAQLKELVSIFKLDNSVGVAVKSEAAHKNNPLSKQTAKKSEPIGSSDSHSKIILGNADFGKY